MKAHHTLGECGQKNYVGFGVQVPKQLYEFPDFPMTSTARGVFPSGPEVQAYVHDFADAFKLKESVRLNTQVQKLERRADGKPGWTVTTTSSTGGSAPTVTEMADVDFAVVATGMYSSANPNLPAFEGAEAFPGSVLHSSQYLDSALAKGKHVVVVGGGKSAADIACDASDVAESSTYLFRNPHWATPRKIAGLIPFQYVFLSRFGQQLVSLFKGGWPSAPAGTHAFHSLLKWPMRPVFGLVELLFALQNGTLPWSSRSAWRSGDVVKDFYGFAQVLTTDLKDRISSGLVTATRGEIVKLNSTDPCTAELSDGRTVPCDLVVCATGFKKDYSVFPEDVLAALNVEADGLWLYRHTVPPRVADLAFCGSEVATISNIATYALQAEWICEMMLASGDGVGDESLPSPEAMLTSVEEHKEWARSWMPDTPSRAALVLLHQVHFHDRLLKDLGVGHRRKAPDLLAEAFMPYEPADYDGIVK